MMNRVFSASFEEVENIIDQNEIDELYHNKARKLQPRDILMTLILYFILIIPLYFFYFIRLGLVIGYEKYPEEFTVPLDVNNVFITLLDNFHYVHLVSLLFFFSFFWFLFERRKSILKASLIYNSCLFIYILALFIYIFKVFQIFIYSSLLRKIYTVLLILVIIYTLFLCYKKAIELIYNKEVQTKKRRWQVSSKSIISGCILLFGIFQVFKLTDTGKTYLDFEQQLIGSMIDFLPFILAFTPILLTLFVKPLIRYYYLNEYSEQFREKFNYQEKEWYGQL